MPSDPLHFPMNGYDVNPCDFHIHGCFNSTFDLNPIGISAHT